MENINFAKNLVRLRKEKQITQEQLAQFCDVTKASVSKWETSQTMPDVLMLPRLAAFFGVSIDTLLGYEMQLSKEQIQKIQIELRNEFANKTFEDAINHCRKYIKQYYSCYELLEKIVLLWLAHEFIAGDKRMEMLQEAKNLCIHILNNCKNISLCNDVIFLQSILDLLLGNTEKTIEILEEIDNPLRLSIQSDEILLSAYIEQKMWDKGNDFAQVVMYYHAIMLVSVATRFLMIHKDNFEKCQETKYRIDGLIDLYNMQNINFHYVTLFMYQMAQVYAYHEKKEMAINELTRYVKIYERILRGEISFLKSDKYMDRLHVWFENSAMMGGFPREKKTIYDEMLQALKAPEFDGLREHEEFITLLNKANDMKKIII